MLATHATAHSWVPAWVRDTGLGIFLILGCSVFFLHAAANIAGRLVVRALARALRNKFARFNVGLIVDRLRAIRRG
jgi:hypothetical protein